MKNQKLCFLLAGSCLLATAQAAAFVLNFDAGYLVGDLAGQPAAGTQWAMVNGNTNLINVEAGIGVGGTNGIAGMGTGGGSNFVYYGFNTTNADLGIVFDANSSVLEYSFQWRPTQALDGGAADNIFQFAIGSDQNAAQSAALSLTIRASGRLVALDGSTNRPVDGLFTLNEYTLISGTVDYSTNTYTVFADGNQLFASINGGNLGFNNAASDNAFLRIGNLNGGNAANYRSWNADNITVIPEPSTYAALFGLLAIGLVILRRRLRA